MQSYNKGEFIKKTINFVLTQKTEYSFKFIVVDEFEKYLRGMMLSNLEHSLQAAYIYPIHFILQNLLNSRHFKHFLKSSLVAIKLFNLFVSIFGYLFSLIIVSEVVVYLID